MNLKKAVVELKLLARSLDATELEIIENITGTVINDYEAGQLKQELNSRKNVELDINKRWEQGLGHHPESEEIAVNISKIDFNYGGDVFGFKFGGDGDSGEHLLYLLDIYFESL